MVRNPSDEQMSENDRHKKRVACERRQFAGLASVIDCTRCVRAGKRFSVLLAGVPDCRYARGHLSASVDRKRCAGAIASPHGPSNVHSIAHAKRHGMIQG
jgi:hypothetical protein